MPTTIVARGDEAELYLLHHDRLVRAVARTVNAPAALVEDACQTAWLILLRRQPDRDTVFGWLRTVAVHEAYRLSRDERRARAVGGPRRGRGVG
jgi:DNA-directed RNA polymerase specialized sigma24 family protein